MKYNFWKWHQSHRWLFDGELIEHVNTFPYLGIVYSETGFLNTHHQRARTWVNLLLKLKKNHSYPIFLIPFIKVYSAKVTPFYYMEMRSLKQLAQITYNAVFYLNKRAHLKSAYVGLIVHCSGNKEVQFSFFILILHLFLLFFYYIYSLYSFIIYFLVNVMCFIFCILVLYNDYSTK